MGCKMSASPLAEEVVVGAAGWEENIPISWYPETRR